ncbi:MAG: class C sortase [Lachnospiraceae bacterium]|nr:class C sortase [Lachnospiraceae bacterium]
MGRLRTGMGILIILAGVGIYACPVIREWQFDRQVRTVIQDFEERYHAEMHESDVDTGSAESGEYKSGTGDAESGEFRADTGSTGAGEFKTDTGSADSDDLSALYAAMLEYNESLLQNGQSLTDAWSYQQEPIDLSAWHIDDNMVGYIEIPDMDVLLPLYLGASAENLAAGAAVLSQTSLPIGGISSNCVIAGHRGYGGMAFFREIESLTEGSLIYIVNPWETLVYQVTEIRVIAPSDIAAVLIQEGRDLVTLMTCHPYLSNGLYRYVVYCERMDESSDGSAKTENGDGEADAGEAAGEEPEADQSSAAVSSAGLIRMEKALRILVPVILTACVCILLLRGKFYQKLKKHEK